MYRQDSIRTRFDGIGPSDLTRLDFGRAVKKFLKKPGLFTTQYLMAEGVYRIMTK